MNNEKCRFIVFLVNLCIVHVTGYETIEWGRTVILIVSHWYEDPW